MEFITQNGQKSVTINPASFSDAINLKKAVMKCLLDAGIIKNLDIKSIQDIKAASLIDSLAGILLTVEISPEFEKAVFECLKCCIYETETSKLKITQQLFNDLPEIREDYYEIVIKCCEVNLRPFFKSLVSEFKTRISQVMKNIPESVSQQIPIE